MKRQILVLVLAVVSAICAAIAISACSGEDAEYSTLEMEEGIVYLTDFSVKYTSEEESPLGEVSDSALSETKVGTAQTYYMVIDFDMQMADDNKDNEGELTMALTVYDADVVGTTINYTNTSKVSEKTEDNVTTITATYTLPEKAKVIKNVSLVIGITPESTAIEGISDICYTFYATDRSVTGYEKKDTTVLYSSKVDGGYVAVYKTYFEYELNSDGQSYSVTGAGNKSGRVIVRDMHDGLPVTAIGDSAFYKQTDINELEIPDSVTSIGGSAFYGCTSLFCVTLPRSFESIGSKAFTDCYRLVEICNFSSLNIVAGSTDYGNIGYYAKNVYTADKGESHWIDDGDYTFIYDSEDNYYLVYYWGDDTEITLPDTINGEDKCYALQEGAFYGSTVVSVTLADCLTSISDYAFYSCSNLSSIEMNENLTEIGSYAFAYCTSLSSVTVPDSVLTLGNRVFYDAGLRTVVIGNGVKYLSGNEFRGCSRLQTVTFGSGLNFIGAAIFWWGSSGNPSLTSVTFVETSGWYASEYTIEQGGSVGVSDPSTNATNFVKSTWGGKDFYRKTTKESSLVTSDEVTKIYNYEYKFCDSLKTVTISNSVTCIGYASFEGCSSLTSVVIGSGVTEIKGCAFHGCTNLASVYYMGTASEWSNVECTDSYIYTYGTTIYYYSETEPKYSDANSYWHYDEAGNVVVWREN